MHSGLKRNCVSVNLIFLCCCFFLVGWLLGWFFIWWLWLWCCHWCYIAISKGHSSNLKASFWHWSWMFLACHTSTCTLAIYNPCFKFPCIVSIRQSCNSIINRMLTYFFPVMLWKKYIHIQLPQGGEMEKKIVEKCKQTTWGSRREMKPLIRLNFIKVIELADRPHHHLHSFEKTVISLVLWLAMTS